MNFYQILKINQMIKSPRLKLMGILGANVLGLRHLSIRVDPVMGCNLACRMCYFSNAERRKAMKGIMTSEEMSEMSRCLFPRALQVVVGCAAEPTLHPDYVALIRLAKRYCVPHISLVTNGQIITYEHLEQMVQAGLDELIVSMHGVTKPVYEYFMQKSSYEAFVQRLDWLEALKTKHHLKQPSLRINYTVNPDNLGDLEGFFDHFGKYDIHTLQLRPMFENDGIYHRQMDAGDEERYRALVERFKVIARERGMQLLANMSDVHYEQQSKDARVAEAVYCYVSPSTAERLGGSWKGLSFGRYSNVSGRRKELWGAIISGRGGRVGNIGKSQIL